MVDAAALASGVAGVWGARGGPSVWRTQAHENTSCTVTGS